MARRIQDEADRLTLRIDEVLKLSRERDIPKPKPVELGPLLRDLDQVWRPRMEQLGVALSTDIVDAPAVQGDAGALRDAIGCLLDNALKYRRADAPDKRVVLSLRSQGRDAVVEVVDNGLGVPPKMRKRIFERFVRVEGPHRGLSGGHGLGLAQVADVIAAHRGKVTCGEGFDGGARFTVRLPGARPAST
jgi:signal transduction histidine kinase